MNYIENSFVCLAAPLLVAIACLRREGRRALIFLLAGMTACLCSAYVSAYFTGVTGIDVGTASHEIAPAVEEIIKFLPVLFYIQVFEPRKKQAFSCVLLVAVGFATFENVCFLTSYGTANLLRLVIRGFGTGAMHVVCGTAVAMGLFFLWDRTWLQTVGVFALLCFVILFHAVFNVLVNQAGLIFWIGSAIPMMLVLSYLLVFRKRIDLS